MKLIVQFLFHHIKSAVLIQRFDWYNYNTNNEHDISGECRGFLCEGSEQCGDSRYVCKDSSTKYCIDQSLRCNSDSNCGALDNSDEDKCKFKGHYKILVFYWFLFSYAVESFIFVDVSICVALMIQKYFNLLIWHSFCQGYM